MSKITIRPNQTILFIGDSITECLRQNTAYAPFGRGFVHFITNYLLAKFPDYNINIINKGFSGDTTRLLKARWQYDCVNQNASLVSILVGINDVLRRHRGPEYAATAVMPEEFETNYRQMLIDLQRSNPKCQIVLIEPFIFSNDTANPLVHDLIPYQQAVKTLAGEFDGELIVVQEAINFWLTKIPSQKWSDDTIHPHTWAHMWLAQKWLHNTGLDRLP